MIKYAISLTLVAAAAHLLTPAAQAKGVAPCRPQPDCQLTADSAEAAAVIRAYYSALAAGDYRTAYAQWGDGGEASNKSYADFAKGFARTRTTAAHILQVDGPEGAAGSLFVTVAVDVQATLDDDSRQHFAGSYILRRVNDVPGASADQLRWHIMSASLHPVRSRRKAR